MPIQTSAVGLETDDYPYEITVRQCHAFAAALGETSDVYFDDARPDGIIAVPSMTVTLEWPPSRDIRTMAGFGATSAERLRGVHAAQDSHFFRLIRPGDRLTSKGRLIAIERITPGTRVIIRFDITDERGDAVVTSFSTVIYRGVETKGEDAVSETSPPWPNGGLPHSWNETSVPILRQLPHVYSECADLWNPIHTERRVALEAGLPDIILHGTCTWALAAKEIVANYLNGDPTRLARFVGRFTGMVIPGDAIKIRHGLVEGGVQVEVIGFDGSSAMSRGHAVFR